MALSRAPNPVKGTLMGFPAGPGRRGAVRGGAGRAGGRLARRAGVRGGSGAAGRAVPAGEVQVSLGDQADGLFLAGLAVVVVGDRVLPDAAAYREPGEAIDRRGYR